MATPDRASRPDDDLQPEPVMIVPAHQFCKVTAKIVNILHVDLWWPYNISSTKCSFFFFGGGRPFEYHGGLEINKWPQCMVEIHSSSTREVEINVIEKLK